MADLPPTTRIVVTPNPVSTGQSIVNGGGTNPLNNSPNVDISGLLPTGPVPAGALNGPGNASQALIRFPVDTPPYYMSLAINDYKRQNWFTVGTLHEIARIILPLPREMIDNHNVRYAVEDINLTGAVGFDATASGPGSALSEAAAAAALGTVKLAAKNTGGVGNILTQGATGALAAAGIAVNSFMTIMLKGPDYKKRDFIWRFSPRTPQETTALRRIIQLINNSMAPQITAGSGSAFFSWPKIWQPTFVYGNLDDTLALNTFRMKKSVLTDASFNYTPNGVFSPFATSKAPTSVDVRLSFLELEFWLGGQFDDYPTATAGFDGVSSNTIFQAAFNLFKPNATGTTTDFNNAGSPLP